MAAGYKIYTFQASRIWDGGTPRPDETQKPLRVAAKNEARARKKLPAELGRQWILISTEPKNKGA